MQLIQILRIATALSIFTTMEIVQPEICVGCGTVKHTQSPNSEKLQRQELVAKFLSYRVGLVLESWNQWRLDFWKGAKLKVDSASLLLRDHEVFSESIVNPTEFLEALEFLEVGQIQRQDLNDLLQILKKTASDLNFAEQAFLSDPFNKSEVRDLRMKEFVDQEFRLAKQVYSFLLALKEKSPKLLKDNWVNSKIEASALCYHLFRIALNPTELKIPVVGQDAGSKSLEAGDVLVSITLEEDNSTYSVRSYTDLLYVIEDKLLTSKEIIKFKLNFDRAGSRIVVAKSLKGS